MKEFNKDVLKQEGKIMVAFKAPWCNPCKRMSPILDELSNEGIPIYAVNIDDHRDIATEYNVRTIPTIKFIENGEVVGTIADSTKSKQDLLTEYNKQV